MFIAKGSSAKHGTPKAGQELLAIVTSPPSCDHNVHSSKSK